MTLVRKAVFPVAGFGTRFLPITKASPKEMLPIVDKPLIQYAVEEAAAAGITEMIFVTGRNKRTIEDHFDKAYELESELAFQGLLPKNLHYSYVRQCDMLGLGHAVLCAKPLIGDEPFAVILADDLIDAEVPAIGQLVEQYEKTRSSVIAVQHIPLAQTRQYGIVGPVWKGMRSHLISQIVEKPAPEHAPSSLGVVGRYVLSPAIFEYLNTIPKGTGGEIQLTDGIAAMLRQHPVIAHEFSGIRYDCGCKTGYMEASVQFGLKHPAIAEHFHSFLANLPLSDQRPTLVQKAV